MILTAIIGIILAGVVIGVLWMKNRELKTENALIKDNYEKLRQRHTELLLSRAETTQGASMMAH